mgnify:CR=1 FL=1
MIPIRVVAIIQIMRLQIKEVEVLEDHAIDAEAVGDPVIGRKTTNIYHLCITNLNTLIPPFSVGDPLYSQILCPDLLLRIQNRISLF